MGFSKLRMGEDNLISITVSDCYGKEIEKWKVMERDISSTLRILNDKFGWKLLIKKRKDSDLDWAKKF